MTTFTGAEPAWGGRDSSRPLHPALVRHAERQAALAAKVSCATARPSRVIAEQRELIAELEALVDLLKGALAAGGMDAIPSFHHWMRDLTPQERALLGCLQRSYPRPLDKFALLDLLPGQDHVKDRQPELVAAKVCHLRRKLGSDAIESVRGMGYRLSARQYQAMLEAPIAA